METLGEEVGGADSFHICHGSGGAVRATFAKVEKKNKVTPKAKIQRGRTEQANFMRHYVALKAGILWLLLFSGVSYNLSILKVET